MPRYTLANSCPWHPFRPAATALGLCAECAAETDDAERSQAESAK